MDKEPAATAFESTMSEGMSHFPLAIFIILILSAGFIAITFLQSGLDKVFDYKGNLGWIGEQFSKTILKNTIRIFLPVIMIGELLAGAVCAYGVIELIWKGQILPLILGFSLAGIVLLLLLFGQRVSKQYAGAVSLTGYFMIVLVGLFAAAFIG